MCCFCGTNCPYKWRVMYFKKKLSISLRQFLVILRFSKIFIFTSDLNFIIDKREKFSQTFYIIINVIIVCFLKVLYNLIQVLIFSLFSSKLTRYLKSINLFQLRQTVYRYSFNFKVK